MYINSIKLSIGRATPYPGDVDLWMRHARLRANGELSALNVAGQLLKVNEAAKNGRTLNANHRTSGPNGLEASCPPTRFALRVSKSVLGRNLSCSPAHGSQGDSFAPYGLSKPGRLASCRAQTSHARYAMFGAGCDTCFCVQYSAVLPIKLATTLSSGAGDSIESGSACFPAVSMAPGSSVVGGASSISGFR